MPLRRLQQFIFLGNTMEIFYSERPPSISSVNPCKLKAPPLLLSSSSGSSGSSSRGRFSSTIFFLLLLQVVGSAAAQTPSRRGGSSGISAVMTTTVSGIPAHEPAAISPSGWRGTAGVAAMPASEVVAFARRHDAPHLPSVRMWRPSSSTSGGGAGFVRDLKMAIAGALAGAIATAALFPIDTAKTLRQANPQAFQGTREALAHVCRTRGTLSIYTGLPTAVLGAMPSSALYFGTYEAVKTRLIRAAGKAFPAGEGGAGKGRHGRGSEVHPLARAGAHALAAACGNAASSLVFVPKEYVKQTLQASGMGAAGGARETARQIIARTVQEKGVRGLYCGYWATLSRNIPSAVIRFSLYEEFKLILGPASLMAAPPVFLLAGALAGACASGLTTPFDVLKTRVATGSLDGGRGFASNMASIVAEDGWKGLYAGFQPRVVMSALFTAVGFSSFETLKPMLGVSPLPPTAADAAPFTGRGNGSDSPSGRWNSRRGSTTSTGRQQRGGGRETAVRAGGGGTAGAPLGRQRGVATVYRGDGTRV